VSARSPRAAALLPLAIALGACATGAPDTDPETPLGVHARCYGYSYGERGLRRDYARALEWCRRAAELGVPSGQTLYAELYYTGRGVEQDYATAFAWYERAAEAGHLHAQLMLGLMYAQGQGVDADPETGLVWIQRSADQGHEKAIELLEKLESASGAE
jgi:TPR repeat protein